MDKAKGVLSAEEIKFLEERANLVAKKNANRKPTKAQEENDGFKTAIVNGMESGKAYTITDLIKSIPEIADLTNQRVSALVRQMLDETEDNSDESKPIYKKVEKRKSLFFLK